MPAFIIVLANGKQHEESESGIQQIGRIAPKAREYSSNLSEEQPLPTSAKKEERDEMEKV